MSGLAQLGPGTHQLTQPWLPWPLGYRVGVHTAFGDSFLGSVGVQCRKLWLEEEDEEPRPHHLHVYGLLLECHCCSQGGRLWSSPSSPTQRCRVCMGCAGDQPCARTRAGPSAAAHGWIWCSPRDSCALRMCVPCVCHLLSCAAAVCESQSHLVSLVCAGAIILPTPGGPLPSLSSAGLSCQCWLARA